MISVVIPVYNRAHYIADCLDSVLNQTYKDYEIVVVDDGSTDNVKEVITPYMNRVRYIHKKNGGAASARNEGIRQAKGDYIAWLDSDDKWLPFKLELEMKVLEKQPENVGFVHTDFSCFTNEQGKIADSYIRKYFSTMYKNVSSFYDIYSMKSSIGEMGIEVDSLPSDLTVFWGDTSRWLILGSMFLPSSILMRKECIDTIGLFNEEFKTGEDFDYLVRVARKYQVAYIDYPSLEYRRFHADQLSASTMEEAVNKIFLRIALDYGLNDKEFYRDNRQLVIKRVGQCYFDLGVYYYEHASYLTALREFVASIRINCRQKKVYMYSVVAAMRFLLSLAFNTIVRGKDEQKGTAASN